MTVGLTTVDDRQWRERAGQFAGGADASGGVGGVDAADPA